MPDTTTTTTPPFSIIGDFHDANDDEKNESYMAILLMWGNRSPKEIARVGVERSNTANPTVSFERQTDRMLATARKIVATLNELTKDAGVLQ